MSKKDYVLIAEAIKEQMQASKRLQTKEAVDALRYLAVRLSFKLLDDNPAFKMNKFLKACGVN